MTVGKRIKQLRESGGDSPGAEREVARAIELGLPVFHKLADVKAAMHFSGGVS